MLKNINIISKICKGIISIIISFITLLSIFEIYAFSTGFYMKEFEKYNIAQKVGIKQPDLEKITYKIFRYLKNYDSDLKIQVSIDGKESEVFGFREKRHMQDVKNLFKKGFFVRNIGIFIGIVFIFILWRISSNIYCDILRSCIGAALISAIIFIFFFFIVCFDFYRCFVHFHEKFFSNDLWLLDPSTDILIQLFPLKFFMDIVVGVIKWFGVVISALGCFSYWLLRRRRLS